jgi:diguanylate cyclase (GGDEF)-like protein
MEKSSRKNSGSTSRLMFDFYREVGKTLTSTLELRKVLTKLMEISTSIVSSEAWSLLLIDQKSDQLVFKEALGSKGAELKGLKLRIGQGIAGWVAKEREPAVVNDVKKDPRFFSDIDRNLGFETRSILCVPLISREKTLGVIEIINKVGGEGEFTDSDLDRMKLVADFASIAIENATLYEKVQLLAITDDLTGLHNSRHLFRKAKEEIEKAEKEGTPLSFIFLDLDFFKKVNDKYGHEVGGEVLKEAALLLKEGTDPGSTIARYGGDEYVIILPGAGEDEAGEVAEKLRKKIASHRFGEGKGLSIKLTASFGVATYPANASSVSELIRLADKAMYVIKNRTRNGVFLAGDEPPG